MGKKRKKWTGGFILGIFIILFIPPLIVNGLPSQQPGDLEELETKINKEVEEYFQSDFIALLLGDQSKVRDPLSITYEGVVPIKGKITYEVSDNRMRDLDQYEREWLYIDFIFYFDKEGGILDIKYEGESGDQTRFTKEEIDGWVRNQLLDIQDKYYDFTIEQQGIPIFYVDMAQTGIAFRDGECVGQFGMDIYKADKGHTFLQRATFSHRELYAEEIRGEYGDYNFDGDMDIRMVWRGHSMQDEDAIGYHYWIWDREKEIFERADKLFGKLSTFCYDSTTKQFYDYEYTSPYPFGRDKKVYEIRQGELVLVKRMVIDYGDPTKITVSKYESGKKKVLYKATVTMEECYRSNEYRKASQFFERE